MSNDQHLWNILEGVIITVVSAMIVNLLNNRPKVKPPSRKKALNLITGVGLILTSGAMIALSGVSYAQLIPFAGFILPFVHPSIQGLTYDQASIFGNFVNLFTGFISAGMFGTLIGVTRIRKFLHLRDPNQCSQAGVY